MCREVSEARSSEMKAWAHVQGLNSSLDERNVELRVKVAIEAEAKAQQRLAASEAEFAELRKKFQASKRSIPYLTNYSCILYDFRCSTFVLRRSSGVEYTSVSAL